MMRFGIVLVATVSLTAGCGQSGKPRANNREEIVGKWSGEKSSETMEFGKDGRLTISDPKGKLPPLGGGYTFTDDDHVEIAITDAKSAQTDEGKKYLVPSWMSLDDVNAMLDGRKVTVKAQVAATPEELSLTVGNQTVKYKRAK